MKDSSVLLFLACVIILSGWNKSKSKDKTPKVNTRISTTFGETDDSYDRVYSNQDEVPDIISIELTDTDYAGGDFFFKHRTIYNWLHYNPSDIRNIKDYH